MSRSMMGRLNSRHTKKPVSGLPGVESRKRSATGNTGKLLLRSKVVQLTEYLRDSIQQGRLAEPFPGGRNWSSQLGVSRRTLDAAIKELQRLGLFTVGRRGVRLNSALKRPAVPDTAPARVVRVLLFDGYQRQNNLETFSLLQERLQLQGTELRLEICSAVRLREIARQATTAGELLLLASIPPTYQRLFNEAGKPALVLGEVAAGVALPFINVDQAGAVRHATFRLLQRGFTHVSPVHVDLDSVGIKSAIATFRAACAEWHKQPVITSVFPSALDQQSLAATAGRLATRLKGRRGLIVVAPVPIGMIVSALLHQGIPIPKQAEVIALFHSNEAVRLYPPPTYYRSPMTAVVKHLVKASIQFFETGRTPSIEKTLTAEITRVE